MEITDGSIASPHWEACESCAHLGENGCNMAYIDVSVYQGDWIICDDYKPLNKRIHADASQKAARRG